MLLVPEVASRLRYQTLSAPCNRAMVGLVRLPIRLADLLAEQQISSRVGDNSRTDAASALPRTRSDRPAGDIPHSDHRDRRGLSCAAAAMQGLPSIRLCRSGSLLAWPRFSSAVKASIGGGA